MTRREFAALGLGALAAQAVRPRRSDLLPQVDLHVHIGPGVTAAQAVAVARRRGMKFGLLQHAGDPGNGYAITGDQSLLQWTRSLAGLPVYKGIEAESPDWASRFSKAAVATLDYVQADALGLPDAQGRPLQIWRPGFRPANVQDFMDRYVAFHVQRIVSEPIDILAVPTYLPDALAPNYDRLWTERRMRAVIEAAVRERVALEMDCRFRVPQLAFLSMARDAGVQFAFGSNFQDLARIGDISYCLDMAHRLKLQPGQIFRPAGASRRMGHAGGRKLPA